MIEKISNRNQESHLENFSGFDAMRISEKDAEINFLREQLEILKQELHCECQFTQVYREEMKDTERELRRVKNELSTLLTLPMLGLAQAKELAKNIVNSKKSISESLANILNGIYNSTVRPGELGQIDMSLFTITSSSSSDKMTAMFIELEADLSDFKADLGEFKAQFEQFKVSCGTSQVRDIIED